MPLDTPRTCMHPKSIVLHVWVDPLSQCVTPMMVCGVCHVQYGEGAEGEEQSLSGGVAASESDVPAQAAAEEPKPKKRGRKPKPKAVQEVSDADLAARPGMW